MKKFVMFIFIFSVCSISFSQDQKTNYPYQRDSRLGFYFNFGRCLPVHFEKSDVSYNGEATFSYEINYLKSFSKHLNFEIGLSYTSYKVRVEPIDLPGMPDPYTESFSTLSIPILYDLFSNKLFHIGFGTVIDWTLPHDSYLFVDSQSGLGFLLNFGKEFPIDRFTIDVSPNLGFHSLIPFKSENTSHVMIQYGIKIGINFNLK